MRSRKSDITVVSRVGMPPKEQTAFTTAVEGLLCELVRSIDRHRKGEFHEFEQENQMGRPTRHRHRPPE